MTGDDGVGVMSIRREELEKLDREQLYKLIFEIELDNQTLYKKLDESLDSIKKAHMLVVEMNKRLNDLNTSAMNGVRYSDHTDYKSSTYYDYLRMQ